MAAEPASTSVTDGDSALQQTVDAEHSRILLVGGGVDHGRKTLINKFLEQGTDVSEHAEFDVASVTHQVDGIPYRFHIRRPLQNDYRASSRLTHNPAFNLCDALLFVIDCVEGVVQVDEYRMRAVRAAVQPIIFLNKLDRFFLEMRMNGEEMYETLQRAIDYIKLACEYADPAPGLRPIDPCTPTVIFGSSQLGFAFTLQDFDDAAVRTAGRPPGEYIAKAWGDHFIREDKKIWNGPPGERCFSRMIFRPIHAVITSCMEGKLDVVDAVLAKFGVALTAEERLLEGKFLVRAAMARWLPLGPCLARALVRQGNSPAHALSMLRAPSFYAYEDAVGRALRGPPALSGPVCAFALRTLKDSDHAGRPPCVLVRVLCGAIKAGARLRVIQTRQRELRVTLTPDNVTMVDGGSVRFPLVTGQLFLLHGLALTNSDATLASTREARALLPPCDDPAHRMYVEVAFERQEAGDELVWQGGVHNYECVLIQNVAHISSSNANLMMVLGIMKEDFVRHSGVIRLGEPVFAVRESISKPSARPAVVRRRDGRVAVSVMAYPWSAPSVKQDLRKTVAHLGLDANAIDIVPVTSCVLIHPRGLDARAQRLLQEGCEQLALAGPLTGEPVHGVAFHVLECAGAANIIPASVMEAEAGADTLDDSDVEGSADAPAAAGAAAALRWMARDMETACRAALLLAHPLLLSPLVEVDALCPLSIEGACVVLARHGGEDFSAGAHQANSPMSKVTCTMPLSNAVRAVDELRAINVFTESSRPKGWSAQLGDCTVEGSAAYREVHRLRLLHQLGAVMTPEEAERAR